MNIKIKLNNINEALNIFNNELISEELNNYITDIYLHRFKKRKNTTLEIEGITNKQEQEKLTETIHSYYTHKLKYNNRIEKIYDYTQLSLLIIGIILIIVSENLIFFPSELLLIAGWVIIWELIYDIIFNEIKRRIKINMYKNLSKITITYNRE